VVNSRRYLSIFDVMRDIHGITGRAGNTTTLPRSSDHASARIISVSIRRQRMSPRAVRGPSGHSALTRWRSGAAPEDRGHTYTREDARAGMRGTLTTTSSAIFGWPITCEAAGEERWLAETGADWGSCRACPWRRSGTSWTSGRWARLANENSAPARATGTAVCELQAELASQCEHGSGACASPSC
jgi:hypothetical protein